MKCQRSSSHQSFLPNAVTSSFPTPSFFGRLGYINCLLAKIRTFLLKFPSIMQNI
jgi:hypothetical protein